MCVSETELGSISLGLSVGHGGNNQAFLTSKLLDLLFVFLNCAEQMLNTVLSLLNVGSHFLQVRFQLIVNCRNLGVFVLNRDMFQLRVQNLCPQLLQLKVSDNLRD